MKGGGYMKGQDIVDFIVRQEMPDVERVREKCHRQAVAEAPLLKRPLLLAGITLTAAAALAVCLIFGSTLFAPKAENSFSIKAYALEQQEDGSFTVIDAMLDEDGNRTGFGMNGNYGYFKGLFMDIQGENIQSVEFSAKDDGDYAKTHPPEECGEIEFAKVYVEQRDGGMFIYDKDYYDAWGNYICTAYGVVNHTPLQHLGNPFTIDADDFTEELVLMVGRQRLHGYVSYYLNITLHAVATFTDGTTQEEILFVY